MQLLEHGFATLRCYRSAGPTYFACNTNRTKAAIKKNHRFVVRPLNGADEQILVRFLEC